MSGTYTKQELLLLSNFVYIPACLSDEPLSVILDKYKDGEGCFTEESVAEAAYGGGMSIPDVKTVFAQMDAHIKENPDFGDLSVSRRLEEKDVRALCYTTAKDEDPVVVFRGTGGTKDAWRDNFEGAFYEDTKIQKVADDFIKNECAIYEDMVVTGHSKGGNLAQYVTVKNEGKIAKCVSYDGQGFGEVLLSADPGGVANAAPKITSISAYNDFVNILLTCIAGTCIYVSNEGGAAAAHSPVTLLTSNTFDEAGEFVSTRPQGVLSAQLGHITDTICAGLGPLTENDKEALSMIAGSTISLALTSPADDLIEGCVIPSAGAVAAHLACRIAKAGSIIGDTKKPTARSIYIDISSCRGAAKILGDQTGVIGRISAAIDEVRRDMACTVTTRIFAERPLFGICERLEGLKRELLRLSEMAKLVSDRYEQTEEEALALMRL